MICSSYFGATIKHSAILSQTTASPLADTHTESFDGETADNTPVPTPSANFKNQQGISLNQFGQAISDSRQLVMLNDAYLLEKWNWKASGNCDSSNTSELRPSCADMAASGVTSSDPGF